jgi:hypothetical protein
MTLCEMHRSSGWAECPNRFLCDNLKCVKSPHGDVIDIKHETFCDIATFEDGYKMIYNLGE